jgi:ABC-type dipeptide/oligopeptide/nickel transport system permease component
MTTYIFWRILRIVPIVLIVVTLIFILFRLVPGDPARAIAGPQALEQAVEQIRKELGLDKPLSVQYWSYLKGVLRGELGYSGVYRGDTLPIILSQLPATLALLASSMLLTVLIGIPTGVLAALYRNTPIDYLVSLFVVSMLSIPNFWLGMMLITFFSVQRNLLPSFGFDSWLALLMPTVAVAARLVAIVTRMTRSSMLEVLQRDFVRTARAKGLSNRVVLYKHALRNALIPTVTTIGLQAGYLLGGSIVIERLFAWPGIGQLMINSIGLRDFNMVQGITIVFSAGFLLINLSIDLIYAVINPRIQYI